MPQPEESQVEQQRQGSRAGRQQQQAGEINDETDLAAGQPGDDEQRGSEGQARQSAEAGEPVDLQPSESEAEAMARLDQQMSAQAAEQWLRKIPDDPGGLLRRKFLYQYRDRGGVDTEEQPW